MSKKSKNNSKVKKAIFVVGPTAVGKTKFAIELAKKHQTEIISADSRQFYKEIPIGTAQPDANELAAVKHHFIASHTIFEPLNAGGFEKIALKKIEEIFEKNETVIVCGGSGLYLNALAFGFDNFGETNEKIRKSLQEKYEKEGIEYLQNKLLEIDPNYFKEVDQKNPQRLMRAIEVCLNTGKPYSEQRIQNKIKRNFEIEWIGLKMERSKLYEKINLRVDEMIKNGLMVEAKKTFENLHLNPLNTVGYKELYDYLEGKINLETAIELIKRNTRRFAKRQMTWFRKNKNIKWIEK